MGCGAMERRKKPGGILAVGAAAFLLWMFAVGGTAAQQAAPPPSAPAAAAPKVDTGDTAWVLTSSALVLAMTMPGLALFYGGLVRNKNVLGTIMHSFVILCLVSVLWVLWGYSLALRAGVGGVTGSLGRVGLRRVRGGRPPAYGSTIPHQVYMLFQLMFAAITAALATAAFAER